MTEYYAWKTKEGVYRNIYTGRILVEMCSPDGYKKATERGDGKIVKVEIKEIKP